MVWFVVDMIRCSCSEPLAEEAVWALQDDVAMEEVVGLYSEACRLDLQAQAVGASTESSHSFPAVNRAEPACTGEHEGTGILKRMAEIKVQLEATHGTNSPSLEKAGALTPRSRLRSGSRGGPKVRHAHPCRCLFLPMTLVAAAPRLRACIQNSSGFVVGRYGIASSLVFCIVLVRSHRFVRPVGGSS